MRNLFTACFIILSLSACSSHYGAARIVSTPPGAEVINSEDGTLIGVTPTTKWWKDSSSSRQHIAIRFKKDGYYEKVSSFWLSMRHKSEAEAAQKPTLVEVTLTKKTN